MRGKDVESVRREHLLRLATWGDGCGSARFV